MFVYLDNAATTRQLPQVTEKMIAMMEDSFGNPSSLHKMGMEAENSVKQARRAVAASIGAQEEEIFFTGGGTEADNTAVFAAAGRSGKRGGHIITTAVEHPAVLEACRRAESSGCKLTVLPVDGLGKVSLDALEDALTENTVLVSVMHVNNELGTVEPVAEIGKLVKAKSQALFHVDAIQSYGKLAWSPAAISADLVALSAHKVHGPKGIGAIYVKKGLHPEAYLVGGGQEKGFRSGTENVPAICGFGVAAEAMKAELTDRISAMGKARQYLMEGILAEISDVRLNSPKEIYGQSEGTHLSSPAVLNMSFLGCRGEVLLHMLEQQEIYVSTGSACSSHKKGSHVLTAAGIPSEAIQGAIRFSFSSSNTIEEMDYVLDHLKKAVTSMRRLGKRMG